MIPDITELNFPKKDGKQYATLTQATANIADMGEKSITTQVKIDGDIVPDFSFDWEVEFQGEKYIMPLRIPQGAKENTSLNSTIDLTFQHWAIYQLKRWPFVTIQQIAAGTYLPDEEVAPVELNLKDFCILFGQVLEYYYGGAITIDLNPAWQYKQEATRIEISHTKIWNVLIDAFHDKYGVRWEIKAASDNSNTVKGGERYVIRVGYPTTEVDHIFEYGFDGGLLKIERQVQSEEIRNMLKGRGGDTNIPFRYFKNTDPNNKDFRPDPDWVEELANIPFTNLMPATFRSYVQGWKAAHINQTDADGKKIYAGYTPVGESDAYAPWAYRKGYTDTKFAPVEFVADEITISPESGDKQVEILPGYSPYVKKGSSLDKYGPLPDTLDDNDDTYPTLQGTGLDIAVAVEQIESDDVAESTESDAQLNKIPDSSVSSTAVNVAPSSYATIKLPRVNFSVPQGKYGNLIVSVEVLSATHNGKRIDILNNAEKQGSETINVYNAITGEKRSASGIPEGSYYFEVEVSVHNMTTDKTLNISAGTTTVKLQDATLTDGKWRNTFDIWVRNIWGSTRLTGETDSQYSERVWKPVLGDREGNEAAVMFTSGNLVHEDYEFKIPKGSWPVYDTSKTWEEKDSDGNVVATHTSHWRIRLAKSDAELEATGLYVPSTKKQGKAGDRFVFIGTEMTHEPYVVDAEVRQADWLKDQLGEKKEIKPTAVVTTDRVRLNNEGKPNALINQLRVGNSLRLFDKRFFNEEGKAYETLYLQSITYAYREPSSDDAALNPDVEIVLGNEYTTSANPVSMMQGEISALQRQLGSISNVEQIVRAVGDKLYLRKDGISDRSLSPTQFLSLLTSGDFRAGLIGGAGWGFFKDENGNWVLEADRINVRQDMTVNTLVINQAEGKGGMEVDTAAYIDGVTRVVETADGYVCYFDQKEGTVANLFRVGDVAYCSRWTPENAELKFYKRRVVAVGDDSITLTKGLAESERPSDWPDSGVNGTGIPAEKDNIIHFGSYTDATRQYVKVRDVIGGGYERYIEELNSVNAVGVEYYFIGKQAGQARWFVGNKDLVPYSGDGKGSYIEYANRKFNLNNVRLSITSTIGDKPIDDYIGDKVHSLGAAYVLVLDSEMASVSADAAGNVTGSYPTSNASVYQGPDKVTQGVAYSIAKKSGITSAAITSAGAITMGGMTADRAEITVQAVVGSTTLTAVMTIAKVRAGADGAAAVTYDVVPSTRVVTRSMTGALSAATVTATTYKTTGGTSRTTTNDHVLTYRRLPDGATGTLTRTNGTSGAVSMLAATEEVVFELKKADGTLLDRETVTVLSDASDLEMSSRNLLINSSEFTVTANTSNYAFRRFDLPIPLKAGDYVALMVEGITNVAGSPTSYSCGLWNEGLSANINEGGYSHTVSATRNTAVFKIIADEAKPRFLIYAGVAGSTAGNKVSFERAILVKGNVPMRSWTCAPEDLAAQLGEMDYIRRAIRDGASQFQGGLMMSSLLRLGSWDLSDPSNPHMLNVYSGLNGVYASDRSIAIFFGGEMLDKEDYYTFDKNTSSWVQKPNVTPPSRIAKGLDRMDGSGYRANGSIWWDAQGHVYADPLSFFVGEDAVGFVSALFSFRKADASPGRPTSWTEVSHVIPNKPFSKLDLGTSAAYGTLSRSNGEFTLDSLAASGYITTGSLHALRGQVEITGSTPYIDFHFGNTTTDFTSRIIETSSGKLSINDTIFASMSGNVGFGTANPQARVHIEGALRIGGGTISWDATNNMFKFDKGVYSMGDVTALGVQQGVSGGGSGGGGGTVALNRLDAWADYVPSMASTHVLSAGLGYDLHTRVNANATAIASLSSQLSQMGGSISLTTQMTGSGNAVTEINRSGTVLVATRGATFLKHIPHNGGIVAESIESTWGSSIGEVVGGWTDSTNSSAFKFKKDNPSAGKMSMLIDGTVYINEGLDAVASQAWVNSRGFLTSHQPLNHLNINDVRGEARLPSFFEIKKLTAWFNYAGMPREDWYSGIHMKGWTSDYASWAICAGSTINVNDKNLYFRVGINSTWEAWQTVLTNANYSSILDGRYVTLGTAQKITGLKTLGAAVGTPNGSEVNRLAITPYGHTAGPWYVSAYDTSSTAYLRIKYGATIAFAFSHTGVFEAGVIKKSGGTNSQFLMADGSVKALTDITSAYVTALGTSRNYLTWTKNGAVNNITVPFATAASVLNPSGRLSAISNAKHGVGIRLYEAYGVPANYPTEYGNVLAVQGDSAIGAGELLMGWSGSDGGYEGLYYRNCRDNTNTWSPWVTILDSTNFNFLIGSNLTAYVKKAGDTMTGALNINTNSRTLTLGCQNTAWAHYIVDASEGHYFNRKVAVNGEIYAGSSYNKRVFHQGFMGSGSGLNADLLDGVHNGEVTAKLINERDNIGTTNITTPGFYFFDGNPANISDGSPTPGNSWNFSMMVLGPADVRIKQLALEYQSGRAYTRIHMNSWSDWKPIAFLTDNVASATKLQTARTLWGQSFDGTGNVSGKMTGASRIANNDTSAPYLMVSGTPSNAGNLGTAVGVGSSPDGYGLFIWGEGTGKGHIQVGRKDGTSTAYNLILQEFGGVVGIGTTSPTEKLSVNGWVGTIGDTGWYSITHMGGWYMADSTWIRSYNNKSIYSGSGIIRSDKYFTREGYNAFSWNSGYGAYNTSVYNDNSQTPLLVAYRLGQTPEATGANRLFAMELLNSGASLRLCLGGAHKMAINKGGLIEIPGSLKIGDVTISWDATNGMLKFDKGVYSMGDVTALGMQKSTLSQDIGSNLLPTADASFDLGSSAKRWSNVHAETVTADYLMPASSSADIGSKANANKRFYHIYSRYGLVASSDSAYADRPNNVSAAGGTYGAGYVELAMDTPFIDFHKTGYVADYHARIILTSTSLLEFQGAAISAHGTLTTSDERLKRRIADVALDVETVAASPMFTFKRLDNGERDFGSSAQYWQQHLPDAVRELSTGYLSMDYGKVALASAQAACRETVALKRRVKMLEEEVERLKNERRT